MSQLGAIAEYISIASHIYAEQVVGNWSNAWIKRAGFPSLGAWWRNSSGRTFASSSNRRTG